MIIMDDDRIRRWRVLAMLHNIKSHLERGDDVKDMVDRYLKFSEKIDEDEWDKWDK